MKNYFIPTRLAHISKHLIIANVGDDMEQMELGFLAEECVR